MIDYANELIEEIKAQKPSNATTITVSGVPIKNVRYTGVGLEISCEGLDFVDKDEYDELENEKTYIEMDNEELEDKVDELESKLHEYEKAFDKILGKIDSYKESLEILDGIYDIIEETRE